MSQAYKVLQKDSLVHAVEIPNCPRVNETQYGYVFFDKSARPTTGPVKRVNKVSSLINWMCSSNCRTKRHFLPVFILIIIIIIIINIIIIIITIISLN